MPKESNPWSDVLGPFYTDASLERRGVNTDGLIGLTTTDGEVVYPHAQFDVENDQDVRRREIVIQLWQKLIEPEIERGTMSGWTASGLLLQSTPEHPSQADLLVAGEVTVDEVEADIRDAIWRFKQ